MGRKKRRKFETKLDFESEFSAAGVSEGLPLKNLQKTYRGFTYERKNTHAWLVTLPTGAMTWVFQASESELHTHLDGLLARIETF